MASSAPKAGGRELMTDDLQEALSALKGEDGEGDVVELRMTLAYIGDEGAKAIGEALKSNGTLTSLYLIGNKIGAEGGKAIGEALKSNGTLTSLNLAANLIGAEGALAIGDALKSNGTLTSLYLWNNQIGDDGATAVGEALKSNGTLTSLRLSFNEIGVEGAKAIGEALNSNGTLTSLDLSRNAIGSEGLQAIIATLQYNKSLIAMDFGGISILKKSSAHLYDLTARNIGDDEAKAIGGVLKFNGTLTSLDLEDNRIGAEGAKEIGEALKSNGTLTSLNLKVNGIGAEGAKKIAEALKSNKTLTSLSLSFNQIGVDGAIATLASLKYNKSLMNLEVGGISIVKESSAHLHKLTAGSIGDDEAKAIAAVLKSNGTLTSLDLEDNQIGAEGARAIGEALKSNGIVTSLNLRHNLIGDEGAIAILSSFKHNKSLANLEFGRISIQREVSSHLYKLTANNIGEAEAIALFCSLENRGNGASDDGTELVWNIGQKVPATSTSLHTSTPALEMIKRLIENGKGNFAVNISEMLGTDELKAFAKGWHQLKQDGISDLVMPPESVINRGSANIRSFFNQLSSGGLNKDRRQKLMILGDASVGKTSLLKSLRNGKPFLTTPGPDRATVGVEIDVWKLQQDQSTTNVANDEQSGDLLVYTHDFGGQTQYLVTHTLFLSQRATILLVFNIKDFPNNEKKREMALRKHILFWLYKARSRAPGATFILVATHCGEQPCGIQSLDTQEERQKCEEIRLHVVEELEKDRVQLEQKKVDLESQISAAERDIRKSPSLFKAAMRIAHIRETLESVKFQLSARPKISDKVFRTSSSTGYGLKELEKEIVSWVQKDADRSPQFYIKLDQALSRKAAEMTLPSTDTNAGVVSSTEAPASAAADVESSHGRSTSKLPVFSFSEVREIFAKEVGSEMRPEDLKRALEYLHDFGSIIYHQPSTSTSTATGTSSGTGAEAKESFIFPNPTALVDALSKLVRHDMVVGHEGGEPYLQRIIRQANKQISDPSRRWNEKHIISAVRRYNLLPMELLKHFELWKDVWESGPNYFYAMLDLVQDLDFTFTSKGSDGKEYIFLYYPMEKLSGAEISDMNSKIAELKQGNKVIGDWRYQFPNFVPSGLFQRLLVRSHSLNPRQDPEQDFVVFSGKQKLFSKMRFVASTLDSASTSSSPDDKIMIELAGVDNSVSSSATTKDAGTSRKELIIRLYVSNKTAATAMTQQPQQSNAHRTREAWELFRNHARSVESILAETPGLDVRRKAVYSPGDQEKSISFTIEKCEQERSLGKSKIDTGEEPNSRSIPLASLIGPPTSAALVPRPGAETTLPQGFVNHILLVGSEANGSHQVQLLANEFRVRGFVVDIARSPEQVRGQVRASFCIIGFLTKGVLQTELFQFVLAEGMKQGRNFAFFFEEKQGPSKFEFSEIGECSETIRPMVQRCQSEVVFTDFQRDRKRLREDIDSVTESLLVRVDVTLFRETQRLLDDLRRDLGSSRQQDGPITYLSQNDFDRSTWRQCESWLDRTLPAQESYARNPTEGRELLVETVHPLPSDDLAFHGFMSHYQGTGDGQCHVLFTELERRGLKVWYDMNQQNRNAKGMRYGVERSACYLLFLSKDVFTRPFVIFELYCAVKARKPIVLVYEDEIESDEFDFDTWGTEETLESETASSTDNQGDKLTEAALLEWEIVDDAVDAKDVLGILNSHRIRTFKSLYLWAKAETIQAIANTKGKLEFSEKEIGRGPAAAIKEFVKAYEQTGTPKIPDEVKFLLPDLLNVEPCFKWSELTYTAHFEQSKYDELRDCILYQAGTKLVSDAHLSTSSEWQSLSDYVDSKVVKVSPHSKW